MLINITKSSDNRNLTGLCKLKIITTVEAFATGIIQIHQEMLFMNSKLNQSEDVG